MTQLTLVSYHLCPYVQRAAIVLAERNIPFQRKYVDLSNKPDWFTAISPLGKVPLLRVQPKGQPETILFESSAIVEYLDDIQDQPLHPTDPLDRARHRGWMEFGSAILNGIGRLYNARSEETLTEEAAKLAELFAQVEAELGRGPYFAGMNFTLVDAVFGPVFRYFDVFDTITDFGVLTGFPKVAYWRQELAKRPSVQYAVSADYPKNLMEFLRNRHSAISDQISGLAA